MVASGSCGRRRDEEQYPTPSSNRKWRELSLRRRKVKHALSMFRNLLSKLREKYKVKQAGNPTKILLEAVNEMKTSNQCENTRMRVGHVLGIEVGDQVHYRAELYVIGLHLKFWRGIDYMGEGNNSLATSIVVTDRYDNARESAGTLVYIGEGENHKVKGDAAPLADQKLKLGNLALKNSMDAKRPVRVILKVRGKCEEGMSSCISRSSDYSFVYDGLYLVDKMTQVRGEAGKLVFKFTLKRILDQPPSCVSLKDDVMNNGGSSSQFSSFSPRKRQKSGDGGRQKDVVRVNDVSNGNEKFPIRVVTSAECVQIAPSFDYIVSNIYPSNFEQAILGGCDCADGCVNHEKCACILKSGGRMLYDSKKRLTSLMESSLIYECGPSCKCSSSCINRVSQHGIQFQLEVFMTKLKGWGVRTRSFIPAGSFICEYIGEVRDNKGAGLRLEFNDYKFHIGVGNCFIDTAKSGNIARFINHSCVPNLLVKNVIYGHNKSKFPYKMFFSAKDIPAGAEISYDYNCSKGKFLKVRNNSCYCGQRQCNGQIYL